MKSEIRCSREDGLVSETMAPILTLSAYCDTELGSVFQRQLPRFGDGQIHNGENAPVPRLVSGGKAGCPAAVAAPRPAVSDPDPLPGVIELHQLEDSNVTNEEPVVAWRLRGPVRSDS